MRVKEPGKCGLPTSSPRPCWMNDSGMTLPNAVHLVATAEYGTLTPHIRKLDNEMSWGVGFRGGALPLREGSRYQPSDRSVDLIAKASRAGGDVSEVLRQRQRIPSKWSSLQQERFQTT